MNDEKTNHVDEGSRSVLSKEEQETESRVYSERVFVQVNGK